MQTVLLANGLTERGHDVAILYLDERNALAETIDARIRTESLHKRFFLDPASLIRIRRRVRAFRPDLVLCENSYATMYGVLACVRLRERLRLVSVQHTTVLYAFADRIKQPVYRLANRAADVLVFVCEAQRTYWRETYGWRADRTEVVHNGVDMHRFRPMAAPPCGMFDGNDFVIGISANFRPEKKHAHLVEAIARLRREGIPAKGLFIGDGVCRKQVEAAIDMAGLRGHIRITGFVRDVRPFVAQCHVMVLCSVAVETFSMAALESMAMGRPVVMTRIGGAAEQVDPGVNGFLYDAGDVTQLTDRLREVWQRNRGHEMGEAAREIVDARFSLDRMLAQYEALFERLSPRHAALGRT